MLKFSKGHIKSKKKKKKKSDKRNISVKSFSNQATGQGGDVLPCGTILPSLVKGIKRNTSVKLL